MNTAQALVVEREALGSMLDHMATLADPLRCRHAARARAARADRVRAVRGAAAAAVDGQPAPEDAGRCRLGTSRRDGTSRYYSLRSTTSTTARARSVAADPRAGRRRRAAPSRTSGGWRACWPGGDRSRKSSSRPRRGSGTVCATSCSATRFSARAARSARSDVARRRPRLRHGTAHARCSRRTSRAVDRRRRARPKCSTRRGGGSTGVDNVDLRTARSKRCRSTTGSSTWR